MGFGEPGIHPHIITETVQISTTSSFPPSRGMCCALSLLPWPYTSLALERKRKQLFSGPLILGRELRMCLHSQLIHVLSIIRSQEKEWHMSENTAHLHTGIRTSTPHIILLTYEEMTEKKTAPGSLRHQ